MSQRQNKEVNTIGIELYSQLIYIVLCTNKGKSALDKIDTD